MKNTYCLVSLFCLTAGCAGGPTADAPASTEPGVPEWGAASVHDETKSTHLWIVDRAVDQLRGRSDRAAANAVALLDRGDCSDSWHQGLLDADYKAIYNDGRKDLPLDAGTVQILVDGSTWASHFFDPDTLKNYQGQTSPTARTRIGDQLANFRSSWANGQVADACYALGLTLHYFTDITQPMHAANYTAKDWPLSLHSNFEDYAQENQERFLSRTGFAPSSLGTDALVMAVAHASKSAWAPLKATIAAAYGARCDKFDSYYKDHTECWQGDPSVDAAMGSALQSAQNATAQFLYSLGLP